MSNRTVLIHHEAGFGLIEVLAAVLVLAVGVIGFAGLQMRAVQSSGDAYYRTQAMAIAQDLAERVRINNTQMSTYLAASTWPDTVDSAPTDCFEDDCTPADMVAFDANSVVYSAQTLLPQGLVKMEACQASAVNCIYVSWDGLQPTAGSTGQCVDANGKYFSPPANKPSITCVMLEVL